MSDNDNCWEDCDKVKRWRKFCLDLMRYYDKLEKENTKLKIENNILKEIVINE